MKRYVISSLIPGAELNYKFLDSIATYCKHNKAELLLIPTQALYSDDLIDPNINAYGTIIESYQKNLNKNIYISLLPINPEQVDPVTGLDRLSKNHASVIYGSAKQRLKSVASPNEDLPRIIMTPGAITLPYIRNTKRAKIAALDHVHGAIIVEIKSNKYYHFRQIQADKDGSFIDLAIKYSGTKITKVMAEGITFGDWHAGYTDPDVRRCSFEMIDYFKPKYVFLHDLFDGISVNHHIEHKYLMKAMLGAQNNLSAELQLCAIELKSIENRMKRKDSKVVVVKSNHDEFLDKWLDEGKYKEDKMNHIIGLELAYHKTKGFDSIEYGLKKFQDFNKVIFLKSDDSFKISDKEIECGVHGHLGPNGTRGSIVSMEKSYTNSNTGHLHSPEIYRGAWGAGTSSYLRLSYNRGPSSWMQSHIVTYSNGSRQLINIINKEWKG